MNDRKWLRSELEKVFIPYPEESFVEWWIENDKLPSLKESVQGRTTATWSKEYPYKVCPKCEKELHISEYHVRRKRSERTGKLAIMSSCKKCSWKASTPMVKRKVYMGDAELRGKAAKLILMKYFDGCSRCGYKGQPPQMDLDHINPKEKTFSLSSGVLAHKTIDEIIEEVDKCQMLCSNCHRLVSTKYEHHIKDDITYHPINDKVLYAMSAPEEDREFLRGDS